MSFTRATDPMHEYSQKLDQMQLAKAAEAKLKYHQKIVEINQNSGRLFQCFCLPVLTKCSKSMEPCSEVEQLRHSTMATTKANNRSSGQVKMTQRILSLLSSWWNGFPIGQKETFPYLEYILDWSFKTTCK